jgi:hypothetical protein
MRSVMWFWILLAGTGIGLPIGIYYCRLKMRARRCKEEVTSVPEAVQLQSLITDLRGIKTDLQGTARLLATRAAQHQNNAMQPEVVERTRRDDDRR